MNIQIVKTHYPNRIVDKYIEMSKNSKFSQEFYPYSTILKSGMFDLRY